MGWDGGRTSRLAPIYGHQQKLKNREHDKPRGGMGYRIFGQSWWPFHCQSRRLTTAANRAQEAAAGRIAELLPEEDKPTWQLKHLHFVWYSFICHLDIQIRFKPFFGGLIFPWKTFDVPTKPWSGWQLLKCLTTIQSENWAEKKIWKLLI